MRVSRLVGGCLAVVAVLAVAGLPAIAGADDEDRLAELFEKAAAERDARTQAFLRAVERDGLYPADRLQLLKESWEPHLSEDPIGDALLFLDEGYIVADEAYAANDAATAQAALQKILDGKPNDYALAYAKFLQAKIRAESGDFEGALPQLEEVWKDHATSMTAGHEVRFFIAYSRASLYERDQAIREFQAYLTECPHAPDRFLNAARQVLKDLLMEGVNPLLDVAGRMGEIKSLLKKEETGDPTQEKQQKVVTILDELIALLEELEKQGSGSGGGGGGGQGGGNPSGQRSSSPAKESSIPGGGDGSAKNLRKVSRGKKEDAWGDLEGKEREEVLQAMKGKFPSRYRALLEQYYKALSKPQ